MATRYDLLPYSQGDSTIDNPLTNIPELALAQQLAAIKNRELQRSIATEAQPQDAMTFSNRGDWLEQLGDWKIGDVEAGKRVGNLLIGGLETFNRNILNWSGAGLSALGRVSEGIFGGESSLKNAGAYLLDLDQDYAKASQQAYYDVNHGNIDNIAEDWHGSGTSLGFLLTQLLTGLASLGAGHPGAIAATLAYLARNTHEALSEAGNAVSDLYAMDKNRLDDALLGGAYSMLGNVPLDIAQSGIEGVLSKIGSPILDEIIPGSGVVSKLIKSYISGLIGQQANELPQEPRQQLTEQALKNTFKSGDMSLGNFLSNYGKEMSNFGDYFSQVAPSVARSTFITHNLTWPFGVAGGAYHTNRYNRKMRAEVPGAIGNLERQQASINKQAPNLDNQATNLEQQVADIDRQIDDYQSVAEDEDSVNQRVDALREKAAPKRSQAKDLRSKAEDLRSQSQSITE